MFSMSLNNHKQMIQIMALALCIFAFVGVLMVESTTIAYCVDDPADTSDVATTIQGAFSDITKKIYDIMRAVIIPCCIVALAFAGFQFLVGGNQGAEKARKVVIGVILAVFFVVFSPLVLNSIGGMVAGSGSGNWDDYNPLN